MSKATVDRAALRSALAVLTKCTHPKATIPVLQHVKLSVNGDVQLSATDLEVGAVIRLERKEKGAKFQALLPAKRLAEYVRKSKAETVSFETSGLNTTLDGSAVLVGLDLNDFPSTLGEEGERQAAFNAQEFADAIRLTKFSASVEVVRYALTGVLLETNGKGGAALVASDGKRLSAAWIKASDSHKALRVIVPYNTVEALERLAADAPENVKVELLVSWVKATKDGVQTDTDIVERVCFRVGKSLIFTRVVEGHFPDWRAVTPSNTPLAFTFDRKAMLAEVEKVAQACTDKTMAVRFSFDGVRCKLFAKTVDVGEAHGEVAVEGNGLVAIVFNPLYVVDYLKALPRGSERVTLKVKDKTSAGLFNGHKGHDYVCMPLTIII